jgi:hypothetical protein
MSRWCSCSSLAKFPPFCHSAAMFCFFGHTVYNTPPSEAGRILLVFGSRRHYFIPSCRDRYVVQQESMRWYAWAHVKRRYRAAVKHGTDKGRRGALAQTDCDGGGGMASRAACVSIRQIFFYSAKGWSCLFAQFPRTINTLPGCLHLHVLNSNLIRPFSLA